MKARLTLLLALLTGCSFGGDSAFAVDNRCTSDSGCAGGVCDEAVCVDADAAVEDLILEVVRSSDDARGVTPASWTVAAATYSNGSNNTINLPKTRPVVGTVRWRGSRVPARLRFDRRNASGSSVAPSSEIVDPMRASLDSELDYSVWLIEGVRYNVVVEPSSDLVNAVSDGRDVDVGAFRVFPTLLLEDIDIQQTDEAGVQMQLDIAYPDDLFQPCSELVSRSCTWNGVVVSQIDQENSVPAPSLLVRAIELGTERLVSSLFETNEQGEFAITISPDAGAYEIRVSSTADGGVFPTVSFPLQVQPGNVLRLRVPRLDESEVTGQILDPDGDAVPGAAVSFMSEIISDGSNVTVDGGMFATATTSNEDGTYNATVLPGSYEVIVTPPDFGLQELAVFREERFGVLSVPTTQDFTVVPQSRFTGSVLTFDGAPGAAVSVLAKSRPMQGRSNVHRTRETVAETDGRYALSLDDGLYDIIVKPPSDGGFGWVVAPDVTVNLGESVDRDFRLLLPAAVRGAVLDSEGVAVSRSLVRAYKVVGTGDAQRVIQVAETTTDDTGAYRLFVAP